MKRTASYPLTLAWLLAMMLPAAAQNAVIIGFEQHARQGEHAGDIDIGAQAVSWEGQVLWNEGDRSVAVSSSRLLERNFVGVPDGQGGAILVFELEGQGDTGPISGIAAQRIAPDGRLLWNEGSKSTIIDATSWTEKAPVAVSDGQGGVIVIWEAHAMEGQYAGDIDLRAQRLSANGDRLWNNGEKASVVSSSPMLERAAHAVPDGRGGAYIVFEMESREGEHAGDTEVGAQWLRADGSLGWNEGQRSQLVASSKWYEKHPRAVLDPAGNLIVVFEAHSPPGQPADVDVRAQKVSGSDGEMMWEGGERSVVVADDSDTLERNFTVVPDGSGGILVAFEMEGGGNREAGDVDIGAQRISAAGERVWNGGVPSFVSSSKWAEREPRAVSDGAGGMVVVFEAHARGGEYAGDIDIMAQRMTSAGDMAWHNGERSAIVSSSPLLERNLSVVADGDRLLIAYEMERREGEHAGDTEVGAQLLDLNGNLRWNNGDRSVLVASSQWGERLPQVIGGSAAVAGDGGAVKPPPTGGPGIRLPDL